jgi:L-asparagine oxygenase
MTVTTPARPLLGHGALRDLAAACGAEAIVIPGHGAHRPAAGSTPVLMLVTAVPDEADRAQLADLIGSGDGRHLVLAVDAAAVAAVRDLLPASLVVEARILSAQDADDPLVDTVRLRADADGLAVKVAGALPVAGGEPVLMVGSTVVGARSGRLTVIGGTHLFHDELLTAAANATFVRRLLGGGDASAGAASVAEAYRPGLAGRPDSWEHPVPPVVHAAAGWAPFLARVPAGVPVGDDLVAAAGRAARLLPEALYEGLVGFADAPGSTGAVLFRGLPVGVVPPTPLRPGSAPKDRVSETVLLAAARVLGQPVGYQPEHGGNVVQDLSPTPDAVGKQVSTSSGGTLMFHTETAFHQHKPRYLLLLCLRGDPEGVARTTLASIRELVGLLPLGVRRVLHEPRFRTAADESFVGARPTRVGRPVPVLSGTWDEPFLTFDADLMIGADEEAEAALAELRTLVDERHTGVVLGTGDLLVIDNLLAVHGRSPFTARFDGTDRWLQRAFVVSDLAPSTADRRGRVVVTRFGS